MIKQTNQEQIVNDLISKLSKEDALVVRKYYADISDKSKKVK